MCRGAPSLRSAGNASAAGTKQSGASGHLLSLPSLCFNARRCSLTRAQNAYYNRSAEPDQSRLNTVPGAVTMPNRSVTGPCRYAAVHRGLCDGRARPGTQARRFAWYEASIGRALGAGRALARRPDRQRHHAAVGGVRSQDPRRSARDPGPRRLQRAQRREGIAGRCCDHRWRGARGSLAACSRRSPPPAAADFTAALAVVDRCSGRSGRLREKPRRNGPVSERADHRRDSPDVERRCAGQSRRVAQKPTSLASLLGAASTPPGIADLAQAALGIDRRCSLAASSIRTFTAPISGALATDRPGGCPTLPASPDGAESAEAAVAPSLGGGVVGSTSRRRPRSRLPSRLPSTRTSRSTARTSRSSSLGTPRPSASWCRWPLRACAGEQRLQLRPRADASKAGGARSSSATIKVTVSIGELGVALRLQNGEPLLRFLGARRGGHHPSRPAASLRMILGDGGIKGRTLTSWWKPTERAPLRFINGTGTACCPACPMPDAAHRTVSAANSSTSD